MTSLVPEIAVETADLIWRRRDDRPCGADFDHGAAKSWPNGADAVRQAVRQRAEQSMGDLRPWIRVGDVIYDPKQIWALYQADREQRKGEREVMPEDEPWE